MLTPEDTPTARPDDGLMVATKVSLLLHTPPLTVLFKSVEEPEHIFSVPLITDGNELTDIVADDLQPVIKE